MSALISDPAAVQALFRKALGNKPHNHEMALALEKKHKATRRRLGVCLKLEASLSH